MFLNSALLLLAGSAMADPREFSTIIPTGTFNPAAATAVQTEYPKDHHIAKGRLVDQIWHIVLDNADYDDAVNNPDLQYLASKGILLDNYYAVESNSQANYLAMIGGDTFGLTEERFVSIPSNVSTLVESLETNRVLWAQYTEDQPFTAFTGWEYPTSGNASYSRAKNPFVAFDSVMEKPSRYNNLRALASFEHDIEKHRFPQWKFIRPNLDHDGTNTNLETAASWVRNFIDPYIADRKHYHRKLFIITFARASSNTGPNKVWTCILGDMHEWERNTRDSNYYDHYSIPASTIANYDLPSLGRYDCSANVFHIINVKCHQKNLMNPEITDNYNQGPFAGYLSDDSLSLPVPNLNCEGRGHSGLLRRVKKIWKKASLSYADWQVGY
ncbi:hypothetical protein DASB73_020180 [Starmerella bacillaris]|uniref:Acid phosphatase n=1 Tax=Starmerella bacillaris TaxID=1247836 RepID=A0AAV5RI52_STABA|nr:hypothetical protein DASB73_020180 [Starmerella bacillaris]